MATLMGHKNFKAMMDQQSSVSVHVKKETKVFIESQVMSGATECDTAGVNHAALSTPNGATRSIQMTTEGGEASSKRPRKTRPPQKGKLDMNSTRSALPNY